MLKTKWIFRDHRPADEFQNDYRVQIAQLKSEVWQGNYWQLLDLVQWFLSTFKGPSSFAKGIEQALRRSRCAYRVVDDDRIVPLQNPTDAAALANALEDTRAIGLEGARTHLRNAAGAATSGKWADSIRESIHAVESVAKILEPTADTLGPAVKKLSDKIGVHQALRDGFLKLYGFTSSEKGVRHALLDEADAKVDETDALFMLGACSAFVSYLIGKGRAAALIA